ncbi:HEPN domain-containing protein [Arsukibacterium sp.]|uniref:HEPN domain-containing protein n=1 Tax=Arsukibacterium sp. TaxID=1977258 RepID=UPI001BD6238E|nr:HEPN domain-containing protein [Arsukibacterium sp.]
MISKADISNKANVYSWGVKIDFIISSQGGFSDVNDASFSMLWNHDLILTLEPRTIHPHLTDSGSKGFRLIINATHTASEAENVGARVAYSLLDFCIQMGWGVELSWPDSPLPCRVIDRTAGARITAQCFATSINHSNVSAFAIALEKSFSHYDQIPYSLLLSMELFAASHFEGNHRSKLIMIMSSLEALATQNDITDQLGTTIKDLKAVIDKSTIQDDRLKNSLRGQLDGLKRESVRSAIKRLLNDCNIDKDDIDFVDNAYSARSKIVHEGRRVPELSALNSRLENIVRSVYKHFSS